MKGEIVSWNTNKGFGFIKGWDEGKQTRDMFFHASDVETKNRANAETGIMVEFEIGQTSKTDKRSKAFNVIFIEKARDARETGPKESKNFDKKITGVIGHFSRICRDRSFAFITNASGDFYCLLDEVAGDVPLKVGHKVRFDAMPSRRKHFTAHNVQNLGKLAPTADRPQQEHTRRSYRLESPPHREASDYKPSEDYEPTHLSGQPGSDETNKPKQKFQKGGPTGLLRKRDEGDAHSSMSTITKKRRHHAMALRAMMDMFEMEEES